MTVLYLWKMFSEHVHAIARGFDHFLCVSQSERCQSAVMCMFIRLCHELLSVLDLPFYCEPIQMISEKTGMSRES